MSTANALLEAWGRDERAEIAEDKSVAAADVGTDARDIAAAAASSERRPEQVAPPVKVGRDGTLPHFVPDRRERLLDALARLGTPRDVPLATRLWGTVEIDASRCTSCRSCAVFCPTGAIRKFDAPDGAFGIDHFPGDCVKCLSCADVCPHDAVTVRDDVRAASVLDGSVERHPMRERPRRLGGPYAILDSMRGIIKSMPVYDR